MDTRQNNTTNLKVTTRRINNEVVRKVPTLAPPDTRLAKGWQLFPELYANIFLCAKKKSGKSSNLLKIIQRCAGPRTKIMAFCATLNKDDIWATIQTWARLKNIAFLGYTSLIDEEGDNLLRDLITDLQTDDESAEGVEKTRSIFSSDEEEEEEEKPIRDKYQYPEWIFIFDDLSDELKKPIIATFLKKNRHFRAKVIISTQYMNDLVPAGRKQLDYLILYGGHSRKKIDEIHRDTDIGISRDEFYQLYEYATEEKYSFLYVDVRGGTFRKNYNEMIEF